MKFNIALYRGASSFHISSHYFSKGWVTKLKHGIPNDLSQIHFSKYSSNTNLVEIDTDTLLTPCPCHLLSYPGVGLELITNISSSYLEVLGQWKNMEGPWQMF